MDVDWGLDGDMYGRWVAAIIDAGGSALIGAVECPGSHGDLLPCPECGAAL